MIFIVGSDSKIAQNFFKKYKNNFSFILSSRRNKEFFELDLNKYDNLDDLPKEVKIAIIFAGITGIEFCSKNIELVKRINYEVTLKLIKDLNKRNIKCLFLSTNCVFSKETTSTSEYSEREPSNIYGYYKKLLEDKILESNMNSILRLTKVIDPKASLIVDWIYKIKNNKKLETFKNVKISPISQDFVSEFLNEWCIKNFEQKIFHLSGSIEITYYQFARSISKIISKNNKNIIGIDANLTEEKYFSPNKSMLECKLKHSRYQNFDQLINHVTRSE
tara:strand:+ start:13151 stop:13978 length:828 start_codon:yes stop_codon:yes gene_type:complete